MRKTIVRRVNRLEALLPPEPPVRTRIQVLFVNRDRTVIEGPTFETSNEAGAPSESGVAAALGKPCISGQSGLRSVSKPAGLNWASQSRAMWPVWPINKPGAPAAESVRFDKGRPGQQLMRPVFYILFASAFTTLVSCCLGRIVLRAFPIPKLTRLESQIFGFLLGSAALSLLVFSLCAVNLALKGIFLLTGLLVIFTSFRCKNVRPVVSKLSGAVLVGIPLVIFGTVYLVNALAPEVSPDGSSYHLAFVALYSKWHGFRPITTNMYANMPQAIEMLFLFAFAFGRHSAAAMVHLTFLFALALLMWSYGARHDRPLAGAAAGALVFVSPIFGVDASSAYNDVALAASGFGCLYLLEKWRESESASALILSGVLGKLCTSSASAA